MTDTIDSVLTFLKGVDRQTVEWEHKKLLRRRQMMFDNWAQPVTSKPWAVVTVLLDRVKRASGYRLYIHSTHKAWQRACGL